MHKYNKHDVAWSWGHNMHRHNRHNVAWSC